MSPSCEELLTPQPSAASSHGNADPVTPKQGQIQHLLPTGQSCSSPLVGKCWGTATVTVTCLVTRVPAPLPISLLASPLSDLGEPSPLTCFGDRLPPILGGNEHPKGVGCEATEAPAPVGAQGVHQPGKPQFSTQHHERSNTRGEVGSLAGRAPQGGRALPMP